MAEMVEIDKMAQITLLQSGKSYTEKNVKSCNICQIKSYGMLIVSMYLKSKYYERFWKNGRFCIYHKNGKIKGFSGC